MYREKSNDSPDTTDMRRRRHNRALDIALVLVVLLVVGGWAVALGVAVETGEPLRLGTRVTVNPFAPEAPPEAAALTDVAARELIRYEVDRGISGAVRVAVIAAGDSVLLRDSVFVTPPGPDPAGVHLQPADRGDEPGAWRLLVRGRTTTSIVPDFSVLTLVPEGALRGGRIGSYIVGSWPGRAERAPRFRTPAYDPPRGFVRVTRETVDLPVSTHFRLGDFLTKGQEGVWPKYVVLDTRLLDKLELTIQELGRMGHPVENVGVISGFRTPHYNAHGGSTAGRGAFSRHMYGDAMDFYIDNARDGRMDDLNGDGRVDVEDARILAEAAARVERTHPHLVGGIGIYRPNPGAHSGFVHVDTRGYRARW